MVEIKQIRNSDYEVTSLGEVFIRECKRRCKGNSFITIKRRKHKGEISNAGYHRVTINIEGKSKAYSVHRLVAEAFIENPDISIFNQVNHKDGNKLNNNVDNLEWSNQSLNTKHAYNTGLLKPAKNRIGMTGDKSKINLHVCQYSKEGNFIKEYESIISTKSDGFSPSNVSRCAKGKVKHYKGYIWKYKILEETPSLELVK